MLDQVNAQESPNVVLLQQADALLRPLVRLLIANGGTYPQLSSVLKDVFIEEARLALQSSGRKDTDSALTLLTGVHRKEIRNRVSRTGDVVPDLTLPQTTTDSDGRFVLRLDPGDYDLDMIPVLGTGPRTSLDNQRIRDVDVDLGEVRLPRLALAKVLVVGPSLAPAPQVKVRVLELPDTSPRYGLACTLDLPCSKVAKVRAEAFTDSKGRVQFLLPDSLPSASLLPHSLP